MAKIHKEVLCSVIKTAELFKEGLEFLKRCLAYFMFNLN